MIIEINGKVCARVRPSLPANKPARLTWVALPFGFFYEIPLSYYQGSRFSVALKIESGQELPGGPREVTCADRFSAAITSIAYDHVAGCVRGFAHDRLRPDSHIWVEALLDGAVVGRALTNPDESDHSPSAGPSPRRIFSLPIRCGGEAFLARGLVRLADTDVVLPRTNAKILDLRNHPSAPEPCSAIAPKDRPRESKITGSVDGITNNRFLSGWALDLAAHNRPIELALFIDGQFYATTRTQLIRRDIREKFGGNGRAGFSFELSCDLLVGGQRAFSVECLDGPATLKNNAGIIRQRPRGFFDLGQFSRQAKNAIKELVTKAPRPRSKKTSVAMIVLNWNGAALLEQFLGSFAANNTYEPVEIIIVDHGSADGSKEIAARYRSGLKIRFIERGQNYSFSDSNNFAAAQTKADVLIFANNDIEFVEDVVPSVVEAASNRATGAVGIKLIGKSFNGASATEHIGVHFDVNSENVLPIPFETRPSPHLAAAERDLFRVPAVTAAFMAVRREVFHALSGFDTGFHYGYEDVDFCLRLTAQRGLDVVCHNGVSAVHLGGRTRYQERLVSNSSQLRNHQLLMRRWASPLRRIMRQQLFDRAAFWTTQAPIIAFAVSEVSETTAFGDYYTAKDFGAALSEHFGCRVTYLQPEDWYNLGGIDVLIAMLPSYDLRRARRQNLGLTAVAWARNWLEEWARNPSIECFHMIWASSSVGAKFLRKTLARDVSVVRLATSFQTFASGRRRKEWLSDYVFSGNYHDDARELEYALSQLPNFKGKVFGHNWEKAPQQPKSLAGPVPYSHMPDVYASTKVVLDDANSTTRHWASVNSRVYDALAAGRLVISNGAEGAREVFGKALPLYWDGAELRLLLEKYLTDTKSRTALAAKLREEVKKKHTYVQRAAQFEALYRKHSKTSLRIGIKVAAPNLAERENWGDYHLARGLARAFGRLGHTARIDTVDQWYAPLSLGDDCALVLRGLSAYRPRDGQVNLAWLISHPNAVAPDELRDFDHVFVASERYAGELKRRAGIQASTLLQCTDPDLFRPDAPDLGFPGYDVLFVGNSRNEMRMSVRLALAAGCDLAIFGAGWEGLVPPGVIKGQHVPNASLPSLYRKAKLVLCDHWEDMRQHEFISNRVFDVAACGARVISDSVRGVDELAGIPTYDDTVASFRRAVKLATDDAPIHRRLRLKLSDYVRKAHSFDARAARILEALRGAGALHQA